MKKMKKYILQLGVLASVATPVAAVISCGSKSSTSSKVNLSGEISKFKDNYSSSKNAATLTTDVGSLIVGAEVAGAAMGIDVPTLSTGVKATFNIITAFNASAKTMLVKVTLTKDGVAVGNLENNVKSDILIKASDHVETASDDLTFSKEENDWFKAGILADLKATSDAELNVDKVIEIFKKYGFNVIKDSGTKGKEDNEIGILGNKYNDFDDFVVNWKALAQTKGDMTIPDFASCFEGADGAKYSIALIFKKVAKLAYKEKDKSPDQRKVDAAKRALDLLKIKATVTTVAAVTTPTPFTEAVLTAIGTFTEYKMKYPRAETLNELTLTYTVAAIATGGTGNMTITITKGEATATATIAIQTNNAVTQEQINSSKEFKSYWLDFGKRLNDMAKAKPDGSTVLKWMKSTYVKNNVASQEPSAYFADKATGDLDTNIIPWLLKFGFNETPNNFADLTAGDPLPAKPTGIKRNNMRIGFIGSDSKFTLYQDKTTKFDTAQLAIDEYMKTDGFYSKTTAEGTLKDYLGKILPIYQYWANLYKITQEMGDANKMVESSFATDAQIETFLDADAATAIALANKYVPGGNAGTAYASTQIGTIVLQSSDLLQGSGAFFGSIKVIKGSGQVLKEKNGAFSMVNVDDTTKIKTDYMLSLGLEHNGSGFSPSGLTDKGNWLINTVEEIAFVQKVPNSRSKSLGYMFVKIKGQNKWWLASDYARYLQFKAKNASEQMEDDAKKLPNELGEIGKTVDHFTGKYEMTDWTTTQKDLYDYVKSTIIPETTT